MLCHGFGLMLVQICFTSTETVGTIRDGEPRTSTSTFTQLMSSGLKLIIIIMYIYHALINALRAHMIHINLNMIFLTHVEHSPIKTIYIKCYKK